MTAPFRRVLVPLDASSLAARVLGPLRPLLADGAEVTLLGVVEPRRAEHADRGPAAELALRAQREELRERWIPAGPGSRIEVRVELARGDAADVIVQRAREAGSDLVAMSTHGRSGVLRLVLGSVAESVLRRCEAPLLLCNPAALERPVPARLARVLVPTDGSPHAAQVLPLVEALARAHGAHVELLRVAPLVVSEVPSPLAEGSLWDPAAVERSLAPSTDRLLAAGVSAGTSAVYGGVATEILRAAEKADLVAMATHGRAGLPRWWLGSVTEEVLRHARCPVLAVRGRTP